MLFIVNSENVKSYNTLIKNLNDTDEIIIVYTENSRDIKVREMRKLYNSGCVINYIHCNKETPTAIDFVIACIVAEETLSNPDREIVIYSTNNDFKSVVSFLNGRKSGNVRILHENIPGLCLKDLEKMKK